MPSAINRSWISIVLVSLVLSGCGGLKTRKDLVEPPEGSDSKPTSAGEAEEPTPPTKAPPVVVSEAVLPKVGIILGPGGIKTMAHSAVLKELLRAKIPVDSIVGMEWGALVAALYAKKGKIHEVEWKMYRLNKSDLPGKGLFSDSYSPERIDTLKDFLAKNLGTFRVQDTHVPFSCPATSVSSGAVVWQKGGSLRKAISRCMPYPPMFKPTGAWVAAAFSLPEAVDYLKKQGMGLIIFIDVLGSGKVLSSEELLQEYRSAIIWQELKRSLKADKRLATEVIPVNTRRFSMNDLSARKSLLSAGQSAGRRAADRIVEKYGF